MTPATIATLYRAHGAVVLRRARRILGSEADAQEVLHDIFTSLLDRPEQFRGESGMTTWLYAATTHGCLNRLRNERTRARLLETHGAAATPRPAETSAETRSIVRSLLARVPEELAHAAVYSYVDEMTHEEMARILSCSRRHVGDLLARLQTTVAALEIEA